MAVKVPGRRSPQLHVAQVGSSVYLLSDCRIAHFCVMSLLLGLCIISLKLAIYSFNLLILNMVLFMSLEKNLKIKQFCLFYLFR